MTSSISFNSLSGVDCFEINYSYKTTEELKDTPILFSNGLAYNKYSIFSNVQDAVISKNNILFLTDIVELSSCLEQQQIKLGVSMMPSLLYLKQPGSESYININDGNAEWSSTNKTPLFFALVADYTVEILTSKDYRLEVSSSYPFRVYESRKATTEEQLNRQRFEVDVSNDTLTLKTITTEGPRYLAAGCDGTVMATGTMLNNTVLNNYLLSAVPISRSELVKGPLLEMERIKYFNQFESFGNKKNVLIQESNFAPTNWLVSTTLEKLINSPDNVNVNIMSLKTNFTPTGTFST